jgi:hypothetical protein
MTTALWTQLLVETTIRCGHIDLSLDILQDWGYGAIEELAS